MKNCRAALYCSHASADKNQIMQMFSLCVWNKWIYPPCHHLKFKWGERVHPRSNGYKSYFSRFSAPTVRDGHLHNFWAFFCGSDAVAFAWHSWSAVFRGAFFLSSRPWHTKNRMMQYGRNVRIINFSHFPRILWHSRRGLYPNSEKWLTSAFHTNNG